MSGLHPDHPTIVKMDPYWKDKWIAALRSGKYEQVRGTLRTEGNHMCCLGVLCDVVEPERWLLIDDHDGTGERYSHGHCTQYPSFNVERQTKLEPTMAYVLGTKNDHDKLDFNQIADWIEEKL